MTSPSPDNPNPYATGAPIPPQPGQPEFGRRTPGDTALFFGPPPPKRKHRGLLILALVGGAILLLAVLGIGIAIGGMSGGKAPSAPTGNAAAPLDAGEPGVPTDEPTTEATTPPEAKATPTAKPLSVEQQNAIEAAQGYLDYGAFSRKGLIQQLHSDAGDGYPLKVATYAVDSLHIDFNEQAYRSAKSYLESSSFSRKELIQQLSSDAGEGFTYKQAVYGVTKAGL